MGQPVSTCSHACATELDVSMNARVPMDDEVLIGKSVSACPGYIRCSNDEVDINIQAQTGLDDEVLVGKSPSIDIASDDCSTATPPGSIDPLSPQIQNGIVYLDNNATTSIDPQVLAAMQPYFTENFGNPSATYSYGASAKAAVEDARTHLAKCIGSDTSEIFFTSGATESDALAIVGVVQRLQESKEHRPHIVTSLMEHAAILEACRMLEQDGKVDVTYLGGYCSQSGRTTRDMVHQEITPQTVLVSVMLANNEIGVVNDIQGIGNLCRENDILFHVDAAQGLGKVLFNVNDMCVDLASFSAHKCYGPKGIGAIYIRDEVKQYVAPQMRGGGQEFGIRGGTHNVPGIVGFGEAAKIITDRMDAEVSHCSQLRDSLLEQLKDRLAVYEDRGFRLIVNGTMDERLPNNLNMSFLGISDPQSFHAKLRQHLAISAGSACTAAKGTISHVMTCLGVHEALARATIRCGVGRFTTEDHISLAVEVIVEAVEEFFDDSFAALLLKETWPAPACTKKTMPPSQEPAVINGHSEKRLFGMSISSIIPSGKFGQANGSKTDQEATHPKVEPIKRVSSRGRISAILGTSALDAKPTGNTMNLTIVGTIHNVQDLPRYIKYKKEVSEVRIRPEYESALEGIDGYSHLWVVWLMTAVQEVKLKHVPQGLDEKVPAVGIFASRCPQRPNHIAQSVVQLLEVLGSTLIVKGLDAMNGSEIIDIKPYTRQFDEPATVFGDIEVKQPWWNDELTY